MYKNAQPRFALADDGRLMDYAKGTTVDATGELTDDAGTWDLVKVKNLIQQGKPIETALLSAASSSSKTQAAHQAGVIDKIKKAWHDFESTFENVHTKEKDVVAKAGADFHAAIGEHVADATTDPLATGAPNTADTADVAYNDSVTGQKTSTTVGAETPESIKAAREARRAAIAGTGTADSVGATPKVAQGVTDAKIPLQPSSASIGTGLDAASPDATSTSVQQNADFKASGKSVPLVDSHDIDTSNAKTESVAAKQQIKEG
jgi:hypothetical protein